MKLDETFKLLALPVLGVLLLAWLLSRFGGDLDSASRSSPFGVEVDPFGIEFIKVGGGTFVMGDPSGSAANSEELPATTMAIGEFWLGRFEVTQAQWFRVMGTNPSQYKDPRRPVDSVTWYDVQEFIKRLNERVKDRVYRLPSEAEWEYAAKAGTATRYFFGDDGRALTRYGWVDQAGNVGTRPVGLHEANPWGFFDMYGNVWEWTADCWHDDYAERPRDARPWVDEGQECRRRVMRGGGWNTPPDLARSASRGSYPADLNDAGSGFRLARGGTGDKQDARPR